MSDDPTMTREELVEAFGKEEVEHTEWWTDQIDLVESVQQDVLEVIEGRADARVTRRGTNTDHSGKHTLTFTVTVAGQPWEGSDE